MKKFFSFAVTAMAILGLGSLTSCHDEDFDVSTAVLQERAFEQGFINEFGQPSADQSWDFYAQQMQSLREGAGMTRATQAIGTKEDVDQPIGQTYFDNIVSNIKISLEDNHNNSSAGQNAYSLTSTGAFKIYAVLYEGWFEQEEGHYLDFGIAYMNGNTEVRQSLFGWADYTKYPLLDSEGNVQYDSEGNLIHVEKGAAINPADGPGDEQIPGYAYNIPSTSGDQFYFYLTLRAPDKNNSNHYYRYYSNSSTYKYANSLNNLNSRYSWNYDTGTLTDRYGNTPAGPSVLLYSMEINAQAQGNKQIMILGFEDGWSDENADADYNDIVIILEGNLPEPTSKRFFCEDLVSFDWDYNDVSFDVSNYGITLRAVGGTLPVFLRLLEKGATSPRIVGVESDKDGKTYYELHELMRSQQYQLDINPYTDEEGYHDGKNPHINAQLTYNEGGKTYYRPIDVGVKKGLWLDPVLIADWLNTNHKLTDDEVERFADPLAENKVGDVQLIVLPEYQESYDIDDINDRVAHTDAGSDANDSREKIKVINVPGIGGIPAIWSAPVSVMWMKELQKITLGYPHFYGGDLTGNAKWWVEDIVNTNTYDYVGDGKDVYVP